MLADEQLKQLQPTGGVVAGIRVFVYGTLKRGHPNHYLLKDGGAEFLGRCFIEGQYSMRSLTNYPCVVVPEGVHKPHKIFGEVYKINQETLDSLDLLEGNGKYFTRFKVLTPWKNAWMYFLPPSWMDRAPVISTGIWLPTAAESDYWNGKTVNG